MNWIISDKDGNPILKVSQEEGNEIIRRGIEKYNWQNCRHGHWIPTEQTFNFKWECSVCGNGFTNNKLNYCYDCGAKMDEVKDE